MTQPATRRETRPQPGARGGGNALTRKIGPLPAWGWAAVAGGAALIWYMWRRNKASQQDQAAAAAAAAGPIAGTACTDAAGNPGFISANGGCDTSLSGTGLPGGGQDAALLAQIRALQGELSEEEKEEGRAGPIPKEPCPPGFVRDRRTGKCVREGEEQRETRSQEEEENETRRQEQRENRRRPPRRPPPRRPPPQGKNPLPYRRPAPRGR